MPYRVVKHPDGSVRVLSSHGVKAAATTPAKAKKQVRLLRAIDHGFVPRKR